MTPNDAVPAPELFNTGRALRWLALAVLCIATVISIGNAYRYTETVANPVIMADAWYFLDAFVTKQLDGTLQWQDFFAKRDAADHAQPLHKLWLAVNTHWFDLDFQLDAWVGFAGLLLCALIFFAVAVRETGWRELQGPRLLILALLPMQLFSLNSSDTFFWPLVMQYHLVLPFALLLFWIAARDHQHSAIALFSATIIALLALDSGGLLAAIATMLTLLLRGIRLGQVRTSMIGVAACVAAIAVHRIMSMVLLPDVAPAPAADNWSSLALLLRQPDMLWQIITIPATASLVHWDAVVWWQSDAPKAAVTVFGTLMALLHLWFWRSVYRTISTHSAAAFACALMLYIYGMLAGIVIARVPLNGVEYLWQMRYVAFFQLANIALILQWFVSASLAAKQDQTRGARAAFSLAPVLALALMGWLQWQVSAHAWFRAPFVRTFNENLADTVYCLAQHPQIAKPVCSSFHAVCEWTPDVRVRLVKTLKDHQLNVFSPSFQQRYGIRPDPTVGSVCVGG